MRIEPLIRNLVESGRKTGPAVEKAGMEGTGSFASVLKEKVSEVNSLQNASDEAMAQGAVAGSGNIHETMIRLEEADIGLRMLTRVRNKVLDAYHEMMRMQF